jgi:hypothetical protein
MIRLNRKRLIVSAVLLFLLAGSFAITWEICDWPPVRLILKYGFPPAGGPTGREVIIQGVTLVEVEAGYSHAVRNVWKREGSGFSRFLARVGVRMGDASVPATGHINRWVECSRTYWITKHTISPRGWLRMQAFQQDGVDAPAQDLEGVDSIALMQSWIEAMNNACKMGQFRRPTEAELFHACETGALGSDGLELAGRSSPLGVLWRGSIRLVGPEWRGFSGTPSKALQMLHDRSMETHRQRLVSPPIGRLVVGTDPFKSLYGMSFRAVWCPSRRSLPGNTGATSSD